ncbi:M56 family metallopeptidase [Georgenia sp. TF02-10]|uniref:M56 family metallopeptidase n=1 Tax=Georgenia sp. TF02-10 TaxID=2917725 RepID=UPI001FA796E8|nr:M56 family metallopeptidase [Georgenia sp. TF02-10]UNX54984.1 M56 family metallopeptidase [Georgenia sp. TF02-10]
MTVGMLTVALSTGLVALAVLGPALLRHAAPALVRVPRLAIVVVAGGIGVWLVTLLAIGPLLAWAGSGPVLLPERAAEVCQRCLSAANPFSADTTDDALVPAVLLLALPVALALALGAGLARQMIRRRSRSRDAAGALLHSAWRQLLHGHEVSLVDAEDPFALTFPARHGGVVLSTGAVRALAEDELAAVLAHEHAHLHHRHHLISALVEAIAAYLRWVPLIRAAADALPHYLEIAADDQARREAGTPALVSALVKLGERTQPAMPQHSCPLALHAAGPERIRHLVRPSAGLAGAVPAVAIAAYLVGMAALAAAVHLPYVFAALTGCAA